MYAPGLVGSTSSPALRPFCRLRPQFVALVRGLMQLAKPLKHRSLPGARRRFTYSGIGAVGREKPRVSSCRDASADVDFENSPGN